MGAGGERDVWKKKKKKQDKVVLRAYAYVCNDSVGLTPGSIDKCIGLLKENVLKKVTYSSSALCPTSVSLVQGL